VSPCLFNAYMTGPTNEDASALGGVISTLVGSGLPIEEGLRAAARELPRGRTVKALATLADRLERGESFEQAAGDRTMPAHLRALVAGGLRSASLGRVLEEFVAAERHAVDVHRKILLTISYPAFLLMLMSCLFAFVVYEVVPGFVEIYEDFDADLPAITVGLVEVATSGKWMVIGNIAMVVLVWLLLLLAMKVAELQTLLVAVPLLGPAIRWAALARFSRLLALLVDMEVPLPQALELAGLGCQDSTLRYASQKAAGNVQAGAALSEALATWRQFPRSLAPMVRWGERATSRQAPSTALADALRTAAEMFDGRLEAQLGLLRAVVPPMSFAAVVWGALFIVSAMMLPMISLIEKLT
jgi:type II secretory pathway component PulF